MFPGEEIVLPSGRTFGTWAFESVLLKNEPAESLPWKLQVTNRKNVFVSRHSSLEEAELAVIALAYFCNEIVSLEHLRMMEECEDDD